MSELLVVVVAVCSVAVAAGIRCCSRRARGTDLRAVCGGRRPRPLDDRSVVPCASVSSAALPTLLRVVELRRCARPFGKAPLGQQLRLLRIRAWSSRAEHVAAVLRLGGGRHI